MMRTRDIAIVITCLLLSANSGFELKDKVHYAFMKHDTSYTLASPAIAAKADIVQWSSRPPEVRPPSDHPPLTIVGGADVYTIHYTTHEWLRDNQSGAATFEDIEDDYPALHGLNHTIWMYSGDPAPRATLMHELFHVAKYLGDGQGWKFSDPPGQNHDFISTAAPEFLLLMRRNPGLVKWLSDNSKPTMQE